MEWNNDLLEWKRGLLEQSRNVLKWYRDILNDTWHNRMKIWTCLNGIGVGKWNETVEHNGDYVAS